MPRGVRDDELPLGRREIAVGDIDGDALLALGPQAVGEEGEIHIGISPSLAGFLHGCHLILEGVLRVVKQSADEGGLAVIDGTRRGETQQVHVQVTLA